MKAEAKKSTPAKVGVKTAVNAQVAVKAVKKIVKAVEPATPIAEIQQDHQSTAAQKMVKPVSKLLIHAAPKKTPTLMVDIKIMGKTVPTKTSTPDTTVPPTAKPILKTLTKSVDKDGKTSTSRTFIVSAPKELAPAAPPKPVVSTASASLLKAPAPLKPGRRSSPRTASQSPPPAPMLPTHAPDAAKASYSTMIERVIAPPPQAAAKKDPKLANNWKTKLAEQLTDEEVKSMPDAEYMNEKQMAFFRYKLSVLKQEIHNSAGKTTEHLREDTVVVPDPADRATIEEEHALELRTRDRERKLLKKIEQSIGRIDSGDYGYCDETGEPIGVGRLIARPTANLSLEAQQRRELKQKMFGD